MTSPPLPSRVAASVTHAPVFHAEPPKVGFAELGAAFPTGGRTVADVQANARYLQEELARWRLSYSILYDRGASAEILVEQIEDGRFSQHSSFRIALECVIRNVTEENREKLDKSLRMVLPPLKVWIGAVIRDDYEFADWQRSLNESLMQLCGIVLDLKLYEGLSDHHRQLTQLHHRAAEREIKLHTSCVSQDEFNFSYNHPWTWLGRWARQNPKLFTRRLIECLCVKPAKRVFKEIRKM